MDRPGVGRNDACPCGSGRKYKKCCLTRGSVGQVRSSALVASRSAQATPTSGIRSAPRPKFTSVAAEVSDDGLDFPDLSEVEVLPIEIGLRYTYPEPFSIAEVSHVLPAGRIYQLADGLEIVNDELEPGMQVVLRDGAVGTISSVKHFYEPPDPPIQVGPGLFLARVVGTIKHKGIETVDVSWPGNTVTGSPDHKFYSVSRGGYVGAAELQVGEILQTDDGRWVPVTSVGERKLGLIDLYNVEVEQFHNYHVGQGPSVLVHNGAEGTYSNPPLDKGPARQKQIPAEKGYWSKSSAKGAPADGVPGESYWHSTDPRVAGHPEYQPVKFTGRYPEFEPFSKVRVEAELTGKPGSGDHKAAAKALAEQMIADPALAQRLGIPVEAYARGKDASIPYIDGVRNWMRSQPDGGLTWHHSPDMTSMMMVPTRIHKLPHAGGADLLRQEAGIKLKPERWRTDQ